MIAIGAEPVRVLSTVNKIKKTCNVKMCSFGALYEVGESSQKKNSKKKTVEAFGITQYLSEHCKKFGIKINTVRWRMYKGLDVETALTKPLQNS